MNNIKKLREKAGLKQTDLARMLKIGQSTVAMWETGETMPRTDKLPALAEIFGCTIDELFKEGE